MNDVSTPGRTRGGAVLVRNVQGEILVSQRSFNAPAFPATWQFPGGSVDEGESFVDGAVRELAEETGLITKPVSVFRLGSWEGEKLGVPYDVEVFLLDAELPIYPRQMEPEKCGPWIWMKFEQLVDLPTIPGLIGAAKMVQDFRGVPFGIARRMHIEAARAKIAEALLQGAIPAPQLEQVHQHLIDALNVGINE